MKSSGRHFIRWLAISLLALPMPLTAQFAPPGVINAGATVDSGEDVQVDHVVGRNGLFHAVWASQNDYTGTAGGDPDIFYSRNAGSGWSIPILVNSYGAADNSIANDDREPVLVIDAAGKLHCLWQSNYIFAGAGADWDVFYASFDGTAWSVALPAPGSVGAAHDELHPSLLALAGGGLIAAWETDSGSGDRDVVWSAISELFWTVPAEIAQGLVPESGDDLGPVALAQDADGTVIAAWSTDDPQTALGSDRDIVMAEKPLGGAWSTMSEVSALARTDSGDDREPAIAVLGKGLSREVHVVWSSTEPSTADYDLLHAVQRLPAAFPPQNPSFLVNSNAVGDSGDDRAPSLCVESGGTLHVAWQTADAFVGDQDVLHSSNSTAGNDWTAFDLLGINGFFDQFGDDDTLPNLYCSERGFISGAWQSRDDVGGLVGNDNDLFHALAPDRGITRPDSVRQDAAFDSAADQQADIAIDRQGRAHVVWSSNDNTLAGGTGPDPDIFYSVRDHGVWSIPELVNINGSSGTENGDDLYPSIVVDAQGTVHVAWTSDEPIAGSYVDLDIFYARRTAAGWSAPALVNSTGVSDNNPLGPVHDWKPQLLLSPAQGLQIAWISNLDTQTVTSDVSWAKLGAGGVWSPEELVYADWSGLGNVTGFCMAALNDDEPHLVFVSDVDLGVFGSDYDLFFADRDAGAWNTPLALFNAFSDGAVQDIGCDLAFDEHENLWLVWSTDADENGAGPDYDIFIGRRAVGSSSWVKLGPMTTLATTDTLADSGPKLVAWQGQLGVVWQGSEDLNLPTGIDDDLLLAQINPAAAFPSSATIRLGNASGYADGPANDVLNAIAVSPEGDLHIVWATEDTLGGTIGSDKDVLHAVSPHLLQARLLADGFE
jgi:hypothetical protein